MASQHTIEHTLFLTIADPKATQEDVARVYRVALKTPGRFPWSAINRAILTRWSMTGLSHVKDMAWREERNTEGRPQ